MKRKLTSLFLGLLIAQFVFAQQPKYIFYMIGDGMGLNHVHLTEEYLAEIDGKNTVFPLVFTTFPFASFATSYSASHGVTDSAAGGTALAVGEKTKNGVIGMDSLTQKSLKSIAYAAKDGGLKVGVITSVSIDHATPAAFYAHQPQRNMYYEISQDLIKSNFDFFGGSGFLKPDKDKDNKDVPSIFPQFEEAGYKLVRGKDEYASLSNKGDKIIYMNEEGTDKGSLPFSIDQKPGDLKLKDITEAAITSLTENSDDGFFLMVEGGKIDWAAHSNDGATVIHEVLDFNESVNVAYEFYKKHPEETLIVVTADHETGGMAVGNGSSTLVTHNLKNQKVSQGTLSSKISDFRKENPNAKWEQVKEILSENLGIYTKVKIKDEDNSAIYEAYKKNFVENENLTSKSLYANDNKIAALAVQALNHASSLGWASGNHSAAYIPIFSIGAGAQEFSHKMENIDIPKKIAKVAGLSM